MSAKIFHGEKYDIDKKLPGNNKRFYEEFIWDLPLEDPFKVEQLIKNLVSGKINLRDYKADSAEASILKGIYEGKLNPSYVVHEALILQKNMRLLLPGHEREKRYEKFHKEVRKRILNGLVVEIDYDSGLT